MTGLGGVSPGRRLTDRVVTVLVAAAFAVAVVPLLSVLWTVVENGVRRLDVRFFTHSMNGVGATDAGGGAYHAIIGTVEQTGLAGAIAIPVGVLTAVFLVEYGRPPLARVVGFAVDVLAGLPSIVAGLFVLACWLRLLGFGFSGFAGALALSILMVPTVVRTTAEMLRLVPDDLREASYALGAPRWRTICLVVLPTAFTGILTGVMLAVARVLGETAPLLLTVFVSPAINDNPFHGPQMALPLFIFDQAGRPDEAAIDRAWTAALTLILIIMLLNLVARLVARLRPRWE